MAAHTAFIRADSDAKLRRAMNQNYRQIKDTVVVGQVVYYWQEKGAGILQKQKWRGPARVVAIDQDKDRDAVIWLAHGTSLLRCATNQVRPRFEDTGIPLISDPNAALKDLQELRVPRSSRMFTILSCRETKKMTATSSTPSMNLKNLESQVSHPRWMRACCRASWFL